MTRMAAQRPDDDFPRQKARTRGFRLGVPHTVTIVPAAVHAEPAVLFLRTTTGSDPVHCLWLGGPSGEVCLVDPRDLGDDDSAALPQAERDRRERAREVGGGITDYSTDRAVQRLVFTLHGTAWLLDVPGAIAAALGGGSARPRPLPIDAAAVAARIDPTGRRVAFVTGGAFRVLDLGSGALDIDLSPEHPDRTWGLAEFIAAEEMDRANGYWWSPDGDALVVTSVDTAAVQRWWISDPAHPASAPRAVRYPAAGTANADVRAWLVPLAGGVREITWDRGALPYLARVSWQRSGLLLAVQSRDQRRVEFVSVDQATGATVALDTRTDPHWVDLVGGSPRLSPTGDVVTVAADHDADTHRIAAGDRWLTRPQWYVRRLHRADDDGIVASATQSATQNQVLHIGWDGRVDALTTGEGWHVLLATGGRGADLVVRRAALPDCTATTTARVRGTEFAIRDVREAPCVRPVPFLLETAGPVRVAVLLPGAPADVDPAAPLPVIVSSYGGPHAQVVTESPLGYVGEQWLADQGFAVVMIDGRGSPGHSVSCERAIRGDLAGPPLADQIAGLQAAAAAFPGRLDLGRVGIRGWSFGGYLAALAVLRRPDVFHAAFAGAPVTDWMLYDTHYTERYLGLPGTEPEAYAACSLVADAARLTRPLMLVHGLADDNVVAAHTLRLSGALLAAGRPHRVIPLAGVTHMTPQESISENLLRLELDFFRECLTEHAP